jgi:hypothetical protein
LAGLLYFFIYFLFLFIDFAPRRPHPHILEQQQLMEDGGSVMREARGVAP